MVQQFRFSVEDLFCCLFLGSVRDEESGKQLFVITRTNCTMFNEAASVCHARDDVKVGFIGVSVVTRALLRFSKACEL